MDLALNFGGFYQGIHEDIIDTVITNELDYAMEDVDYFDETTFYNKFDYPKIHLEYAKYYVREFFISVLRDYGIKLTTKSKNISIISPKEYNFYTDVIILSDVSKTTVKNLTRLFNQVVQDDDEFKKFIRYKTTGRDGYIPYYSWSDVVNRVDVGVSLEFLLQYLASDFNDYLDMNEFIDTLDYLLFLIDKKEYFSYLKENKILVKKNSSFESISDNVINNIYNILNGVKL